jgi:Bacterial Ig domain
MKTEGQKNESSVSQMKMIASLFICFGILLLPAAACAGTQSSADYSFTAESIDGGGLRSAGADYASDGSFGAGDFVTSADYAQRGGYAGQLNNAPVATNYTFTVVSNGTIKVPISALLSAAADPDGDSISFVSVAGASAQNGTVGRSGVWVLYKPPAAFTGSDGIAWVMQDSEGDRSAGTILAQVIAPPPPADAPTLNLISITFDPAPDTTDATLRFGSLPGETYTVQYTDSLTPPVTWTTLGTAATTNGMFQIVDPTARNASERYYRTLIQQ